MSDHSIAVQTRDACCVSQGSAGGEGEEGTDREQAKEVEPKPLVLLLSLSGLSTAALRCGSQIPDEAQPCPCAARTQQGDTLPPGEVSSPTVEIRRRCMWRLHCTWKAGVEDTLGAFLGSVYIFRGSE